MPACTFVLKEPQLGEITLRLDIRRNCRFIDKAAYASLKFEVQNAAACLLEKLS